MKLKTRLVVIILLAVSIITLSCSKKQDGKRDSTSTKSKSYNEAVEKGLQKDNAAIDDLLYEEQIGEDKIIFFTAYNALGIGYAAKNNEEWEYERIEAFYDFKDMSKNPSPYMACCKKIETPSGKSYYLAMGKIFNDDIAKLTLSINDSEVDAVIRKRNDNKFWFKLFRDNTYRNNAGELIDNIRIYDKKGRLIE